MKMNEPSLNLFKKSFLYSLGIVLILIGLLSYNSLIFPLSLYGLLVTSTGFLSIYFGYSFDNATE